MQVKKGLATKRKGRPMGLVPVYQEIADRITEDIRSGRNAIGSKLPPENELGEIFGAGRHTIREALRILTERGLIMRRPGTGSTVIAQDTPRRFVHSIGDLQQLLQYPENVVRTHVESGFLTADRKLAGLLHCSVGQSWYHIHAIRSVKATKLPLNVVDIYVDPHFAGVARSKDHESTPVHQQIERMFNERIERVEVDIFCSRLSEDLATQMLAEADAPALIFVRRYFSPEGKMLQGTVTTHPEDRYQYSLEFRLSSN